MPRLELVLPTPHAGQAQVIAEARRFNVLDCGRRFGKTTLGIDRCVTPDVLAYPVGWFSPSYKMMLEVWREVVRILEPIIVRANSADHRIENLAGGVLEFWSLDNPDNSRGRRYKRVIVDEAAITPKLMEAWQYTIRSTLIDWQGDAYFLSTPKGRNGFWQMWQWGQDPTMTEWASWQMPSGTNPRIAQSELDAMRLTMPERVYQQEVEAQFLEDAGGVFRGVVDAATMTEQAEPRQGHSYVIACDWGRSNDYTVLAVMDAREQALVYLDRFSQIDYVLQMQRVINLAGRFKPVSIVAESNAMGQPVIDQLARQGLPMRPFVTTNASKSAIIDALALAFEQKTLRILNDPILIGELQSYEMMKLPSGLMRYGAPEGMHDDTVMALAIGWWAIQKQTTPAVTFGSMTKSSNWGSGGSSGREN